MQFVKGFVLLSAFILCGCASYQIDSGHGHMPYLEAGQPVYVAWASGTWLGENKALQKAFVQAFSSHTKKALSGRRPLSLDEAFALAQYLGKGYLVYPQIIKWEDNNTPWSTIRDKVSAEVIIVDMASMRVMSKHTLNGTGSMWSLKNLPPDIVLPELAQKYVTTLYKGE